MTVQIGNLTSDRVRYDAAGDVLYLHRGDPSDAVAFDASPEGHALRFDRQGDLVGVTILNVRWLLDHEGEITTLTIPTAEQLHLAPEQLSDALAVA
jgi:uncharacterized protein YuzE